MSAFFQLHPNLRHAIVHELGWNTLRPVQEQSIEAVLAGDNAIVLAPTAGGKTEASIFPLLSRILSEELAPVAVLYICPIRALLNNQEHRIKAYARMVGLDAFKWHGDVGQAERRRFREAPTHILMTTPESLEVMLMTRPEEAAGQFAGLSAVVVDEVHAFAGDDRGAHLVAILERLVRFCGRDLQRIGLSATVGNPDRIGQWLAGSSQRPYRRVDPAKPPALRELSVDLVESDAGVVRRVVEIGLGRKSLVFAESRRLVEQVAAALQGKGIDTFVHHGSVSREDRERAEARFQHGTNTAIVCTSTLELGIDVGDLDHVIQIDAPRTVSSFLQRMGRTGRRAETVSNCHFLCRTSETMLQAAGLIRLMQQGWVEDVVPETAAAHVLAHQIIALSLQEMGISRHRILTWLAGASPFRGLSQADLDALIDTMLERDILYQAEGRLSLGAEGEKRYAGKNFFELYAVFDTPPIFRVQHGRREVGSLDFAFLHVLEERAGPALFRLAGQPWQVRSIDWRRAVCYVEPADRAALPRWSGEGGYLSFEVCQSMKAVLADTERYPWLSPSAAHELAALRLGYKGLVTPGEAPIERTDKGVHWHTFAGGAINALLAAGLEEQGGDWKRGNLGLSTDDPAAAAAARASIQQLAAADLHALARRAAGHTRRGGLSKFQPCLPDGLELELIMRRTYDPAGTERFLAEQRRPQLL